VTEDEAVRNVRVDLVFSQEVERLQRVAVGMGLRADEGEDMLQDVYLKILDRPPKCRGTDQAKRWLMRVTLNQCLSELRRRKLRGQKLREVFEKWAQRTQSRNRQDQQMIRTEEIGAVRQALAGLSELLRPPLVLKYYCGLNASEIAQILELKPGTVRKRLCEGRILLAKVLLQRGVGP
jgi:RNA polymerase sigma-70 factor (ECF subfamily)